MATLSAEYGRWPMEIAVGAGEAAALVEFPSLAEAREDFEKRYIWKK